MKKLLIILLFPLLLAGKAVQADEVKLSAEHALVVEASTGKILFEKNPNQAVPVSSISQLLTVYLVYEAIDQGKLKLNEKVSISDNARTLSQTIPNDVPLNEKSYTVAELLNAILVSNADGACVALAEKIAGSEKKFVQQMQTKVKDWKLSNTTIVNASGQNTKTIDSEAKKDQENLMSAHDAAFVALRLTRDFPKVLTTTAKDNISFGGDHLQTSNYMLHGQPNERSTVTGLKTGDSEKGGASFVGTATENGLDLITVVLNVVDTKDDYAARFLETSRLLSYISQTYTPVNLIKEGEAYHKSQATVINGKAAHVSAIAKSNLMIVMKYGSDVNVPVNYRSQTQGYQAPIKAGEKVGTATYKDSDLVGDGYLTGHPPTITMVAADNVRRANFIQVMWNEFVRYVNEKL